MSKIIVVTSGKGGVAKTTSSASISTGLALRGKKTCVVDFDIGLRNLDLIMGAERRVVYDFVDVINDKVELHRALIRDKRAPNLYILAASQTTNKDALTKEGVGRVMKELQEMGFDYIICDSPAGIEQGAIMALYYADEAIIVTNPEISSVRDSDRIIGILDTETKRAEDGREPIKQRLLISRYNEDRVEGKEMLSIEDILDSLGQMPILGVIPESRYILEASNKGEPVIHRSQAVAAKAYDDVVSRILGDEIPLRHTKEHNAGILRRIFGGAK